jgi:putative transposase
MAMRSYRKTVRHYETPGEGRYLTFSCYRRLQLFKRPDLRDAFANFLESVHQRGAFRLFAWVVMPEHVHVLLSPALPRWTLPRILRSLKQPFAQHVIQVWRESNAPILRRLGDGTGVRFWQRGGGYDRNVRLDGEVLEKIDYIHMNPARRGLVCDPLKWPWSSARWYAGDRTGPVTIDPLDC